MTKEDLLELREKFRIRFKEHDFCIGEGETEKFFRELLGEPEPVVEYSEGPALSAEAITYLFENLIPETEKIFNRDDTFYTNLKKR